LTRPGAIYFSIIISFHPIVATAFLVLIPPPVLLSTSSRVSFEFIAPLNCPAYLSVLALFKNEAPYLAEWLEYHLLVGIDRFWLVNNDSTDNYMEVLDRYIALGIVNLRSVNGSQVQVSMYNKLIPEIRFATFWLAVIDIDEFLVPEEDHCLHDIFHGYENEVGIEVNWLIYGSNGQKNKTDGLVIERFPNHVAFSLARNRFTKMVVNPREMKHIHVHRASFWNERLPMNPCGLRSGKQAYRRPACHRVLRVNHYMFKSAEEWKVKRNRGRPTSKGFYEMNEILRYPDIVTDDRVMDWFVPRVKANLRAPFSSATCTVDDDRMYYLRLKIGWGLVKRGEVVHPEFAWLEQLRAS
jgi:hypothetical protein